MSRISRSKVKSQRLKVFVGLSGGVDSSVSAALLSAKGGSAYAGGKNVRYDITGVFIRVWTPASERLNLTSGKRFNLFDSCQAADDRLDAMRVCAKLGIPFVELDLEKEYKKEVVDYMLREYKAGKTPNPDVFCNRFIKFGGFYNWARKNGADFVATGHYARIAKAQSTVHKTQTKHSTQNSKLLTTNYLLLTGADSAKDQSYFLWQIRNEQLPHILFPVGEMKKTEVRRIAKKFGLITADKKDSQGLCFVGKVDMKEFLSHYIRPKKGKVLDESGEVIGEHDGASFYTIGERIGDSPRLNLKSGKRFNLGESHPLYVILKDMEKNTLTVSRKSSEGKLGGTVEEVLITDCNWLTEPKAGKTYGARIRYRQPLQTCHLAITSGRGLLLNAVKVAFERPQTVAPGQSLVLYDGDVVVGGGVIA